MKCAGQIGWLVCQYATVKSDVLWHIGLHNTAQQTRQIPPAEYMADAGGGQTTPGTKGEANERDCVHFEPLRVEVRHNRVGFGRVPNCTA